MRASHVSQSLTYDYIHETLPTYYVASLVSGRQTDLSTHASLAAERDRGLSHVTCLVVHYLVHDLGNGIAKSCLFFND